jgi:hypothetical protein
MNLDERKNLQPEPEVLDRVLERLSLGLYRLDHLGDRRFDRFKSALFGSRLGYSQT